MLTEQETSRDSAKVVSRFISTLKIDRSLRLRFLLDHRQARYPFRFARIASLTPSPSPFTLLAITRGLIRRYSANEFFTNVLLVDRYPAAVVVQIQSQSKANGR